MSTAVEAVEFAKLSGPKDYARLQDFSCGRGEYDTHVNVMVAQLCVGAGKTPGTDPFIVMKNGKRTTAKAPSVVVMKTSTEIIGVSAYHLRTLYPIEEGGDDAYVWVIGVSANHQKEGHGRRLLNRTMEFIAEDWRCVPDIWAYVSPTNPPSHALFRSCGFTFLPPADEGHDTVRLRVSADLIH